MPIIGHIVHESTTTTTRLQRFSLTEKLLRSNVHREKFLGRCRNQKCPALFVQSFLRGFFDWYNVRSTL